MNLKRFIFDSLKTKFEGISDKVLNRIAAKLAKTAKTEEEATTAVEELTLQQVIDSYSDSRVTEAQEKAIGSYEKKHGLKDGKRIKPEDADDADMDDLGEGDDDNDVVVNVPKGGKGNGKGDENANLVESSYQKQSSYDERDCINQRRKNCRYPKISFDRFTQRCS